MRARSKLSVLARRACVAALLSVLALLGAGASSALAGPGVVLNQGAGGEDINISGSQIAGASNTGPITYTDRERAGGPSKKISLRGVTIPGLLSLAGVAPGSVSFVQVVGDDGSVLTLRGAEITGGGFAEGPALFTDEGSTTRFFRPARRSGGTTDNVPSAPGTPLEVTVDGGSLLSVRASARPRKVKMGQTVTFTASVNVPPGGAQVSYTWDFGDGQAGTGATVTHRYQVSGDLQAQVKAQATGGSQCSSVCAGVKSVDVRVTGDERRPDEPQGTPDGTGGSPNLGGQGGTGGGTGTGDGSGSGSGSGSGGSSGGGSGSATESAPKSSATPSRQRPARPEPEARFSSDPTAGAGKTVVRGVLLSGPGAALAGKLPEGSEGGSPKPQQGKTGTASQGPQIGVGAVFALAVFWLGALSERRRVKLRLA
ncbi:MAG: PKD domain-containing protein [Solirubrobacteraceae bacterium]